ncbi:MAG: hypothetical protein HYV09_26375 [Deltaproteobacteria bacterium]|nr:hypothetical protein [Deltaproteobacteria bacterium]
MASRLGRMRASSVHPWLLPALGALGWVACGPAREGTTTPKGAAGGEHVTLAKAADVPPPAASVAPIAYKPFTIAPDASARRPLVPPPTAIPQPKGKGTVDDSGDETPLKDVLLGSAPAQADKDKAIDADAGSVAGGVRLVIDSPYQIFSKVGTYIHVAAWLPTFAPAANARVFVDGKLRGKTDATGTFVFRDVPDASGAGGGSHAVTILTGEGKGRLRGGANYNAYARTQSFERANLYVYTDRGVFNPGETIHVRAFAWRLRGDYRPFADAPVNVLLRKDGKVLGGGRVSTDKMGIAWLDLPLPSTAPEGPYELAVEHIGERATARLQIKRIVAPAVRIEHSLPRFLVRDVNELGFDVKLATSTGEPFKSGNVTVRCLDPKGNVVATEVRPVLGPGPHKFSLDGERLKKMRDGFADDQLAAVVVEVQDGATGRKDELRRDLRISRAPWRLVVETDRNEHVPGETVKVVVHTTDLEQSPAPGMDIEIVAKGYDDEGGKTLEKTVVAKTDTDGLAQATFTMTKGSLDLVARMVKAKSVQGFGYVSASPPRAMFADIAAPMVTEKAKTPVEIKFPSQYVPAEKVVHADVVDSSGALIHSFLVPITKEKGEWVASGSFPAPSWGSMLITFFALGVEKGKPTAMTGLLTDGANLPVVASRPITVTLKAPTTALPGAPIAVDIALDGPKINGPRPFAIGAAIADDSMLALLDPLERTPTQVLYNPERKVMASTGSQILTWPVVQKTWGTWNYDIALPPFGFRPGGVLPPGKKSKSKGGGYEAEDLDGGGDSYGYGGLGMSGMGPGGGGAAPSAAAPPPPPSPMKKAADEPAPAASPAPMAEAKSSLATGSSPKPDVGVLANAKKPEVKISIRTDFAPTSFWLPEKILPAPQGKEPVTTQLSAKLPDTIGTHRVTVVATDDRGAIGVGKATIKVDQDVSVRSDLPPVLAQGDEVEVGVAVRNTRPEAVTGTVALSSAGVTVVGAASQSIVVPASSTAALRFRVRAAAAGAVPFTAAFTETRSPGVKSTFALRNDTEQRVLWVKPHGVPVESRVTATLGGGKGMSFEIDRAQDDQHIEADLAIAFPSAVPMVEGLEELVSDDSYMGVDPDASRLLAAIALEGYLLRTGAPAATVARVHERLQLAATALLLQQQSDGGWGWRWDTFAALHGLGTGTSPYASTHALHALAKLRDTNIPVPDAAIVSGRSYLLRSLDQSGEVDVSNVAFWEGDGPSKKRAATMAAFQAIAATEKGHPVWGSEKAQIEALADKARAIVKGGPGSEDPLTLTSAVMGLWLHGRAVGMTKVNDDVEQGIKSLLGSYRGGYWEPSWFHAWGGRIEATRGVIELLTTVTPGAFEADLHDAVNFVLSTRPSWGAWHNAWGTAAAIEALTFLDPTPPEKDGATVSVSVDGKVVRTVKIDPDDPFVSAASLRTVDLSAFLTTGKHEVRVAYDGNLTAPSTVTIRRFGPARVESFGLKVERALTAASVDAGATTTATIKVTSTVARPEITVTVPLAAGIAADGRALEALVKSGAIAGFREAGSLVISLHDVKPGTKELKVPLVAARKGTFTLAPVRAVVPRAPAEAFSDEIHVAVK